MYRIVGGWVSVKQELTDFCAKEQKLYQEHNQQPFFGTEKFHELGLSLAAHHEVRYTIFNVLEAS